MLASSPTIEDDGGRPLFPSVIFLTLGLNYFSATSLISDEEATTCGRATDRLHAIIEKFQKESTKQADVMVRLIRWMMALTVAMVALTVVQVGLVVWPFLKGG